VSKWRDRVLKLLRDDPSVRNGIAQVFVEKMVTHIDESYGRAPGGGQVAHKPLKSISGRRLTTKPERGERVIKRVTGKDGRTMVLVETPSYRAGGHPLRDTGHLIGNLGATGERNGGKIRITLRGPIYGLYQDRGFSTKGPNFIPLTMRGKRGHGTGNNPNSEGLIRGHDYFMARKGVTVPSRPFLLPTRREMKEVGVSIYLSLKKLLKGR
jgi:hypothetical protein